MKLIGASLFFLCLFLTAEVQTNTLVVIRGTANSGKSSLCKRLSDLDSSYKIVSEDEINRIVTYEVLEALFPAHMDAARKAINHENLWQAIKCFNVSYKEGISKEESQKAIDGIKDIIRYFDDPLQKNQWQAIRQRVKYRVLGQLLFYRACSYNIIFDAWGVTNWNHELEELKKYFDHSIIVVAYCSLETVIKRWEQRNNQAKATNNTLEKRFVAQMLKSFFGFLQELRIKLERSVLI